MNQWSLRFALFLVAVVSLRSPAQTDHHIYTDSLQNGWQDWGWATINYNNTSPVHSGSASISVTIVNNTSQAIFIHHTAMDTTPYTNLTFWLHGGASGGQQLKVQALSNDVAQVAVNLPALTANTWQPFSISLSSLGMAGKTTFTGFWIQDRIGAVQPTFYVDDIALVVSNTVPGTSGPVAITIDAARNRRPISPLIYGVAFASLRASSTNLNAPLNRWGGNSDHALQLVAQRRTTTPTTGISRASRIRQRHARAPTADSSVSSTQNRRCRAHPHRCR